MILSIDLGSTQMKLMCVDNSAKVVKTVTEKYPTYAVKQGYLEQKTEDWENALEKGIKRLKAERILKEIECITFSGHMSSLVLVNELGKAIYPCIMLADSRSEKQCDEISDKAGNRIKNVTGNPIINAFTLPKLLWIKENEEEVYKNIYKCLNAKDYLRAQLSGVIDTEYTDAYNWICVNPETADYDWEIVDCLGLRRDIFPKINSPFDIAGKVTRDASLRYGIEEGIPIVYGAADMAAGAIGNNLFEVGDSTLTLGTCATFLSMVSGKNEKLFGKTTFHMHALRNKFYALGSHINGGFAVNFISKFLSEAEKVDFNLVAQLSKDAEKIDPGSNGLITIPFLTGSGSPYFDIDDRQTILFMNSATTRADMFKSELEGITFNLKETDELYKDINGNSHMILGGGGIKVGIWPQMIADIFDSEILIADNSDASTIGSALIAGKAIGLFNDLEETVKNTLKIGQVIYPNKENRDKYKRLYKKYLRCYKYMNNLYKEINEL